MQFRSKYLFLAGFVLALCLFSSLASSVAWAKGGQLDPSFLGTVYNDTTSLRVKKLITQPDGKVLVFSDLDSVGGKTIPNRLFRLNQDGTLDQSFTFDQSFIVINDMAAVGDGRVYVAGSFSSFGGVPVTNVARLNADGTTDSTFLVSPSGTLNQILLQPDGKVIIAGRFSTVSGSSRNSIARLNPDGSVDSTFNPGIGPNEAITGVSLQSDGKLLLCGEFSTFSGSSRNRIARLNSDGSLDLSFGAGTGPDSTFQLRVFSQPDGKALVTGSFLTFNGLNRRSIVRLLSTGAVDTGFAAPFNSTTSTLYSAKILADGKILLGGSFTTVFGQSVSNFVRLNSDGTHDTSLTVLGTNATCRAVETDLAGNILLGGEFTAVGATVRRKLARLSATGVLDTTYHPNIRKAGFDVKALAVQPDEKILVAGNFSAIGETDRSGLARLNVDGSLDTTFSPGTGPNNPGSIYSMAVQADGKILIGGSFTAYNGTSRNRIARLNPNGSLDSSFVVGTGIDGDNFGSGPLVYSMALQPDGKILVSGFFNQYNGNSANGILRLNPNGAFDTTFQTGSGLGFGLGTGYSVAVDSNGGVLVSGQFINFNGTSASGVVRLLPNGSLDTAFQANLGSGSGSITVFKVAVDQQGRILVGGAFSTFNQQPYRGFVRLNADGTIDSTFLNSTTTPTTIYQILPLPNGKVILVGEFTQIGNVPRTRIAQLNANGSVDGTFKPGAGLSTADNSTPLVRQNSKILLGGRSVTYNLKGVTPLIRIQTENNPSTPGQFRPTNGFVYLRNTNDTGFANTEFFYGVAGDIPVSGDWDGDGIDTVGIYRNGTFFLRNSNNTGFADLQFPFGAPGDFPIAGDWDGDGIDTIGVVRGNTVFLRNSNTSGDANIQFSYGTATDIFITGDWDGDGIDTIGAFRPTNGFVYLRNSNTTGFADLEFFYGVAGDIPVAGDWDGDGIDTIGIVRAGQWFLRNSNTTGFADIQFFYGVATDIPITGDWNGLP